MAWRKGWDTNYRRNPPVPQAFPERLFSQGMGWGMATLGAGYEGRWRRAGGRPHGLGTGARPAINSLRAVADSGRLKRLRSALRCGPSGGGVAAVKPD
jgi:hypothetical protein